MYKHPAKPFLFQFVCLHWYGTTLLQWRHNERDGVSNHQPHDCLFNRLFRCRLDKTSKLRVTGLCGEFTGDRWIPQRTSNAENISIWWRLHVLVIDGISVIYKHWYVETFYFLPVPTLLHLLLNNTLYLGIVLISKQRACCMCVIMKT